MKPFLHVSTMLLVLSGAAGCDDETPAGPDRAAMGVYSEFLTTAAIGATLDELASADVDLNFALQAEEIGSSDVAALLTQAESSGVRVRLWLVLPTADGYWPNEDNLELFHTRVRELVAWIEEESLAVDAIVWDMEPSYEYTQQIRDGWAGTSNIGALIAQMAAHIDPDRFLASRNALTAAVEDVQAHGIRAVCVTYPQVIDDVGDDDDDLQDALDIPVREVPFDEVAIMVYQTSFAEATDQWFGPGLITSFAQDAREQYGDRAVIALGQVGSAGIFEGGPRYETTADLGEDVAAARAEGISRVEIYSLDGMVGLGEITPWLDTAKRPAEAATVGSNVDFIRQITAAVDTSLDDGGAPGDAGAGADAESHEDGGADDGGNDAASIDAGTDGGSDAG